MHRKTFENKNCAKPRIVYCPECKHRSIELLGIAKIKCFKCKMLFIANNTEFI